MGNNTYLLHHNNSASMVPVVKLQSGALRALLVALLLGLVMACGLLYITSLDLADTYPEVAHLRMPIIIAVFLGLIPMPFAVRLMFEFLKLVDRDDAFSDDTVRLLRHLESLFAITAAYLTVGFIGVSVAFLPQGVPSALLLWLSGEVALLFLFTLTALLKRLFAKAQALRQDNELTV